MKQDISHLKNLINSAKLLADNISQSVNYNTPFDNRAQQLAGIVKQIIPLIKNNCPEIANILEKATSRIINRQVVPMVPYGPMVNKDFINAFFFGDIRTTINILSILYPLQEQGGYKIFISHSSDDETIVNAFIKDILIVGCGFRRTEIFCTLDHTVIRTGDDFRNEIIENMKRCDYILCMISDNYRKSEVCQNELGAAWSMTGKRVLPFKFPNINFKEISFLNVVKQTADLTDKSKLDELYDELCQFYDLPQDWRNFNQQKDDFIKVVNENIYE